LKTSGSLTSFVSAYLPLLTEKIFRPLIKNDSVGIKDVVTLCKYYNLLRDDLDIIDELTLWPSNLNAKNLFGLVSTKTKMAFTRALNKEHYVLPYQQPNSISKNKRARMASDDDNDDGGETLENGDLIIFSDL